MVVIREVHPADRADFSRWHDALESGALAGRTAAATVSSVQQLAGSLAAPSPVKRRIAVGAFAGEDCLGAMLFELPLRSDPDTALVEIDVPPPHRTHGVGGLLWEWAAERAAGEGRTVFASEVNVPAGRAPRTWPGLRFAEQRGFTSEHVEDHLVADLPLDPARVRRLEAASGHDDGYRVTAWVGRCPDGVVEAWADLHTVMSQDVPTGGMSREPVVHTVERVRLSEDRMADGWITLSAMAMGHSGEPVGYSTLLLPRTQPKHAHQDDTLVLRSHRGHGLGARLKLANLRQYDELPTADRSRRRWLHTYTAQDNLPMQRVNARFGFRPVETMHELERRA